MAASLALPPLPRAGASAPIRPRSDWGASLPPGGGLEEEHPDNVRFLLLHHSASGNDYEPDSVPSILGAFYRHHTATQGWPDVAYNFFVDRYGTIWEGRAGSLDGPVKGDATGGSQGFALLCCFVGDHTTEPPTEAAADAMVGLCAALALQYGIDPTPGARTVFVSRGSNKWPEGAEVETATVAGHRDMSQTACPGDAGYRVVTEELPGRIADAHARLEAAAQPSEATEEGHDAEQPSDQSEQQEDSPPQAPSHGSEAQPDPAPERRPAPEPGTAPEPLPEPQEQRSTRQPFGERSGRDLDAAAASDSEDAGSLLDGLGLRELTALGVAAAAAGSAAAVTRTRRGQAHDGDPSTRDEAG